MPAEQMRIAKAAATAYIWPSMAPIAQRPRCHYQNTIVAVELAAATKLAASVARSGCDRAAVAAATPTMIPVANP
jgi:hypothetical protein